jgi:hypothetical protein
VELLVKGVVGEGVADVEDVSVYILVGFGG